MAKTSEEIDASVETIYGRMRDSIPTGGESTQVDNLVYTLQSLDTVLTSVRNVRTLDVDLSEGWGWGLARAVVTPSNWVAATTASYQATRHAPSYIELMKVAASRDRRTQLLKTPEAWELLLKRNSTLREYYDSNKDGMTKLIASNSGMSNDAIQNHAIPLTLNILEAAGEDAETLAPQVCNLLGNSSALNADTEVDIPKLFSDIIDITENPSLKAAFLSDENLEHISGTMVELNQTRVGMQEALADYGVDKEGFVALQPVLKGLLKSAIEEPEKKAEILNMVSMLTGMQNEEAVDLDKTLSTIKNVLKNEDLAEALSEPRAQKAFVNALLTTCATTESISSYVDSKKLKASKALGGALVNSLAVNPEMLPKFGKILDKEATNAQMLDNVFEFIKEPALQHFVLHNPEAKEQLADLVSSVLVGTPDSPGALGALGADAPATRKAVDMVLNIAAKGGGVESEALDSLQQLVQTSMSTDATTADILTKTSKMLRSQPPEIRDQMVESIPSLVPQIAKGLIPEGYVSPEALEGIKPLLKGLVTVITDKPALISDVVPILDKNATNAQMLDNVFNLIKDPDLQRHVLNNAEAKEPLAALVASVLVGPTGDGALGALGADAPATRKAVDMVLNIAAKGGGVESEALDSLQQLVQTSMSTDATTADILTKTSKMLRSQPPEIRDQMVESIPSLVPQIAGKLIPKGYISDETTKKFGPLLKGLVTSITDNPELVGKVSQIIDNPEGVASRLNQVAEILGDKTLCDTLNTNKAVIADAAIEAITNQPDGALTVPNAMLKPLKPLVRDVTQVAAEHPGIFQDVAVLASGNLNKKEFHKALANIMDDPTLKTTLINNKENIAKAALAFQIKSSLDAELDSHVSPEAVAVLMNSPENAEFVNRTAGVIEKLISSPNKVKNIGEVARLFAKGSKFKGAMKGARFAMGNAGLIRDVYKVKKDLQKNIKSLRTTHALSQPVVESQAPKVSRLRKLFTRKSAAASKAPVAGTVRKAKSQGHTR